MRAARQDRLIGKALGLLVLGLTAATANAATTSTLVYDSIPTVVPGNVPSQAFEATQTVEFGDKVRLGEGGRQLDKVRVILSSWGCEGGDWTGTSGPCLTTPGSTFTHPLTLNIHSVAVGGGPGVLLATKTVTPNIPYRPSSFGPPCAGERWSPDGGATCFNGFATPVEWDFSAEPVVNLPSQIIWTVAYSTSHYGVPPIGEAAACYTEDGGCGYDSLNVGAETFAGSPFAGQDLDPDGAVLNSGYAPSYCDSGAGGTGSLRLDTAPGCWAGFTPLAEITTIETSTTVVVAPTATSGWGFIANGDVAVTTNNATGSIKTGPGGQVGLLGGSVLYNTESGPGGKPQLYGPAYLSGTKFADVTSLDYRTFISRYATDAGGSHLTHTLNVKVDLDGNLGTTTDLTTLVFEPCYTVDSCVGAVQPLNTWTTWSPLATGQIWWSTSAIPGTAFTTPFGSYVPLDSLYAAYPNAKLVWFSINAGQSSGGAPWNNFTGNLDGATFGSSGTSTVYDFEPLPGAATGTLILGSASLRKTRSGNGTVSIAGTLRATDTQTGFEASALAGSLTLRVQDGAAYDATVPLTGCVVSGKRRNIVCRSSPRGVSARFRTVLGPFLGQYVYAFTASASGLPPLVPMPLTPPPGSTVTVTLHESLGIDRTDVIGDRVAFPCTQKPTTVKCRER